MTAGWTLPETAVVYAARPCAERPSPSVGGDCAVDGAWSAHSSWMTRAKPSTAPECARCATILSTIVCGASIDGTNSMVLVPTPTWSTRPDGTSAVPSPLGRCATSWGGHGPGRQGPQEALSNLDRRGRRLQRSDGGACAGDDGEVDAELALW